MPHVPHMWDRYDDALEACRTQDADSIPLRKLARAAAYLVANGQLTEEGALSDARGVGLAGCHLDELQHHLDDLL